VKEAARREANVAPRSRCSSSPTSITRTRTGVARDGYSRDLLYIPEPEAPTRLMKQLAQLGAAMLAIGVDETETWRLLRKIGWDSVPAVRVCSARYG
jgi:hypothetical protein